MHIDDIDEILDREYKEMLKESEDTKFEWPTGEVFRVRPITVVTGFNSKDKSKLAIKEQPTYVGLGIEKKDKDSDYYTVTAFAYYNEVSGESYLEYVDKRELDALKEITSTCKDPIKAVCLIEEFLNSCEFALQAVKDANEEAGKYPYKEEDECWDELTDEDYLADTETFYSKKC